MNCPICDTEMHLDPRDRYYCPRCSYVYHDVKEVIQTYIDNKSKKEKNARVH